MTAAKLEDDIMIWSWGQWAREGIGANSYPAWVILMLQGWRECRAKPYPDIDDDQAMRIDRLVSGLPESARNVCYSLYVCNRSINDIARIQRRSKHAVAQDRDFALATIWGAMGNLAERAQNIA
ncbi:hypothetical protein [Pseudohongiella sp. O18]|uniref:hypothetical protein n=1 Tax=Pseudohongiella sp. O18 TaxID=2904248 RepID=UPI001F3A604F|nr:hypothetical protein [Pseudohongiella sp. O18]